MDSQMENADFREYGMCQCGAITLFAHDGRSYSCIKKNLRRFLPNIDLRRIKRISHKTYNCGHCVNHYGLDICACGSGEPYEKCDCGYEVCGKPMQKLGEYDRVVANGSWLSR